MKNSFSNYAGAALSVALAVAATSCSDFLKPGADGCGIEVSFVRDITKSASVPDTNSFILSVQDDRGKSLYYGSFGAAPQKIVASPGIYTVSAVSREFDEPLFDAPQYGDIQVVSVEASKTTSVKLSCAQTNAGVRLNVSPDFIADHQTAALFLKSAAGSLEYGYKEKRLAFFPPGSVCLVMSENGTSTTLFTRNLSAQQILVLNITTASSSTGSSSAGISIGVDTTRNWVCEDFIFGSDGGDSYENAYSVSEALSHIGEKGAWVYGYIVGGDLSSSKCSFDGPFSSRTNLVIASKSTCRDKMSCISVQLPKGDIRDALNLVDHEENLGRQVFLKGDLVDAYYGIPGIQNLSEMEF